MAEPEKALLDFLYFHSKAREMADFESYRFNLAQMRADLDREKLAAYCALFASSALTKRLSTFTNILDHVESF